MDYERAQEVLEQMPSTGDCLREGCDGQYNAFGRCTTCGDVD